MEEVLLLQIFSGQRKKSRLRCEAVCKRWQSLIKQSASSLADTARSIDSGSLILHKSEFTKATFSRFDEKGRLVDEHSIYTESIFFRLSRYASLRNPVFFYYTEEDFKRYSYHVYNPLTQHHTHIPPITTSSSTSCNALSYPDCLGYAPRCSQKDGASHFKFVVAAAKQFSIFDSETQVWETEQTKFSVFGSETGVWKTADQQDYCSGYRDFDYGPTPCLFLDGDLFWPRSSYIFAFRLKTWTARYIKYPPRRDRIRNGCFCESDRCLKYCELHLTPPGYEVCIWVLDEPLVNDGANKWRLVFVLSKNASDSMFLRAGHSLGYHIEVFAFDEDEGIIYLETPKGLLSWDISEKPPSRRNVSSFWASRQEPIFIRNGDSTNSNLFHPLERAIEQVPRYENCSQQ